MSTTAISNHYYSSATAPTVAERRAAAVATVRARLNLNNVPSSWTYEQRNEYNKMLAAYLLANAEQFDDATISTAEYVAKQNYTALEDQSFNWTMFAEEATAPISEAAQSVGNGIFNVANLMKWLLPLLAIVAAFVLLNKYTGGAVVDTVKQAAAPKPARKPRAPTHKKFVSASA